MKNEPTALDEKLEEALLRFEYQQTFARGELFPRVHPIEGVRVIIPGQKLVVFASLGDAVEYEDISVQNIG